MMVEFSFSFKVRQMNAIKVLQINANCDKIILVYFRRYKKWIF